MKTPNPNKQNHHSGKATTTTEKGQSKVLMVGLDGRRDMLAVVDGAGRRDGGGLWWCVWSWFRLALEGFMFIISLLLFFICLFLFCF